MVRLEESRFQTGRKPWAKWLLAGGALCLLFAGWMFVAGTEPFTGFLSNFLATLGGVALGVPAALYLTAIDTAQRERDTSKEAKRRRDEVLDILGCELIENRATLLSRRGSGQPRHVAVPFLMDEVWAAVSDGGQLQWIADDRDLLRSLARAFVFVRTMIFLERALFEATHTPAATTTLMSMVAGESTRTTAGALVAEKFQPYFDHQDNACKAAIDEALAAIRDRVGREVTCPDATRSTR